jgi:hypothetical protein
LQLVRAASVDPPLTCSLPLVDAVLLRANNGALIPVANYTLTPFSKSNSACVPYVIKEFAVIATRFQRPAGAGYVQPSDSSHWLRPCRLRTIARIETIHQRAIEFETTSSRMVKFALPLDASDYIMIINQ